MPPNPNQRAKSGSRRQRWLIILSFVLCMLIVFLWHEFVHIAFVGEEHEDQSQSAIIRPSKSMKSPPPTLRVKPTKVGREPPKVKVLMPPPGGVGWRRRNNPIEIHKTLEIVEVRANDVPKMNELLRKGGAVLNSELDQGTQYMKAKPLSGQQTSDAFFKPVANFSSFWCGGPPGDKNVFGFRLDPRHYCVLRNVCVKDGRPTLFVKDKSAIDGLTNDNQPFNGLPHCVFREVGQFWVNADDNGKFLHRARQEGRFLGGLTAFISSSYGQQHITHFMESLGQMFHALNVFGYYSDHGGDGGYMRTPLGPNLDHAPDGLSNYYAFNRSVMALVHAQLERVLVAGAGGVNPESFNEMFYRMMFTNRKTSGSVKPTQTDFRPRTIDAIEAFDGKCFDEMLLVGASYDPFHQIHTPSYFRHRDWYYGFDSISAEEQAEVAEKMVKAVAISDEAQQAIKDAVNTYLESAKKGDVAIKRPIRRVLVAHRKEKRKVANAAELDLWLASTLPTLLPQYEWQIRSVNFGALSNHERVQIAHWADILIGIHGADLTNLINMRPASVVIELNMLFFFESRFREMSRSLQMHYYAWTCTRKDCTTVWNQVVRNNPNGHWIYDYESERIRLNPSLGSTLEGNSLEKYKVHAERTRLDDGWFKWPTDRYVGFDCLGCDIMSCCTSMQETLYGAQRESDIIFRQKEFDEMLVVMEKAAASVGTLFVPEEIKPFSVRLEEAIEANKARSSGLGYKTSPNKKLADGKDPRRVVMPQIEDREVIP